VQKPNGLNEIWPERDLCKRLDLPVTKSGRSLQINNWVRDGLPFVQKSGRRYFFEEDVIDFLWRAPRGAPKRLKDLVRTLQIHSKHLGRPNA
jgi:hypothetical protein